MKLADSEFDERTERLGTASIVPLLFRLSIPGIVGMLVMMFYNIVDTYWVSGIKDGTNAIAALTILMPIQMVAGAVGIGISAGVSSLVSRRSGQRRHEEVNEGGGHSVSLPFLLGAVMGAICAIFPRELAVVFGAHPQIVQPTADYLSILAFGLPFLLVVMSLNGFYRGMGNAVMPMVIMIVSAVVNMVVDPFLIYGWGPFPEWGLHGAGLSTAVAQFIAFSVSAWYLWGRRSPYSVSLDNMRLRVRVLRDIAQVGAPSSAMAALRPLVGVAFNWALKGYGPEAIAAQGIAMRVMGLLIAFIIGFHHGIMPIVGFNFGAKNYRRMWGALGAAAALTFGIGLGMLGIGWFGARSIVRIFTDEPGLIRLAMLAFHIKIVAMPIMAPQMMVVGTLEGMGKGMQAMWLTLSRQLLFVLPLLAILPLYWGVVGVFLSQPAASVLSLLLAGGFAYWNYRQYPAKVGDEREAEPAETLA